MLQYSHMPQYMPWAHRQTHKLQKRPIALTRCMWNSLINILINYVSNIKHDLVQVHCFVTMSWQGNELIALTSMGYRMFRSVDRTVITAEEGPRTKTYCTPCFHDLKMYVYSIFNSICIYTHSHQSGETT